MTLTLADLEAKGLVRLEIVCDRCPRRGVYRVAQPVEQHGREFDLVRLRLRLAADYPTLPNLFLT
jgi:hypothetical protein